MGNGLAKIWIGPRVSVEESFQNFQLGENLMGLDGDFAVQSHMQAGMQFHSKRTKGHRKSFWME